MAEEARAGGSRIASAKDLAALSRDVLLTLVIAICVLHPASIKNFLRESGLSKLSVFGLSVELAEEKEKLEQVQEAATAKVLAEKSAQGEAAPPPEALNAPVDPALKQTVTKLERIAPELLPRSGWIFLGRVDASRSRWEAGSPSTITPVPWPIPPGTRLTIRDDVYVRGAGDSGKHATSPVVSVAKVGDSVQVVEFDFSAARAGGFFVWAKVALN